MFIAQEYMSITISMREKKIRETRKTKRLRIKSESGNELLYGSL